jgi:hypothetical protein
MKKQTSVDWLINELDLDNDSYHMKRINQAKEMEKQQMIKFAEYVATYPDKNRNHKGEILHSKSKYDGAERTIDLLEQYYNETFNTEK